MKRVLVLMSVLLLAACAGDGDKCVRLSAGAKYCLVDGSGPEFETEQAATVTYSGNTMHMITRIRSGKEGLHFAGITPLGQTLLQVSWENNVLHAQLPPGATDRIDGAMFVALLQLAVWPAQRVREGLSNHLSVTEHKGGRIVSDGDQKLLTISWEGAALPYDRLRFEVPAAHLVIDSRVLNEADIP
jgi:hypothetical protein